MAHYSKKFSMGKRERDMSSLEKGPQVGDPGIQALGRSVSLQFPSPHAFVPASSKYLIQFSHSVVSNSLRAHKSQHARPPCASQTPGFTQTHLHRVTDTI